MSSSVQRQTSASAVNMLKVMNHRLVARVKQFQPITLACGTNLRKCHTSAKKDDSELPWQRDYYKYFLEIQTRFSDNDQYGHVNNATYYSYFDTVINHYLIKCCGLNTDLRTSNTVGFMVHTDCSYRTPVSFPEVALAGLCISHIGRSSIHYTVAIFPELSQQAPDGTSNKTEPGLGSWMDKVNFANHSLTACAVGHCVHVFVNTDTNRPVPLPDNVRASLEKISVEKQQKPTSDSKL
ncbi:uncharacterized protein LOC119741976 isoform X2 [Patiria miniata]|uniref:Thioesterase domain-containing protein n=1 Tax=Patiria miniata TaxID=46514 RepID=A0A914BCV7_PATMI|nr:uncharacterized protein LOC119741976 isoform X2 [Patiria miniata]